MISWPDPLVQGIARQRAVLFLGAGTSLNSVGDEGKTPPDWRAFLERGIEKCEGSKRHLHRLLREGELLTLCEIVKKQLAENFTALLEDEFTRPKYEVSELHKVLFQLNLRLVITTNFDKLYDTYAQSESVNTVKIKSWTDGDIGNFIRGDHRLIIKAHGSIDNPPEMIFTRNEYARAMHQKPEFYSLLDSLVLTHTFLFVGCSLNDPDLRLMLEKNTAFFRSTEPHYICLPRGRQYHADIVTCMREDYNLKTLLYRPIENHKELTESVKKLVSLVEDGRKRIAETQGW